MATRKFKAGFSLQKEAGSNLDVAVPGTNPGRSSFATELAGIAANPHNLCKSFVRMIFVNE